MPSKIVVDKQKSAGKVKEFGSVNAKTIAKNAVEKVAKKLPAGADPAVVEASLVMFIEASAEGLGDSSEKMGEADEAHTAEKADDIEPRNRRDENAQELYSQLVDLRDSLKGAYGPRYVRGLGFSSETPRDPAVLIRFAREVLRVFRKRHQEGTLPPLKKGFSFNPNEPLSEIESTANDLEVANGDVTREQREYQDTLAQKNKTMGEYDDNFSRTARMYAGLSIFAGLDEQAKKILPSERRPGVLEEEEEEPLPTPTDS